MIQIERYIFRIALSAFLACLVGLTGTIWVTQALRELDLHPEAVLVAEPTWLAQTETLRGYAVVEVELRGRATHSSTSSREKALPSDIMRWAWRTLANFSDGAAPTCAKVKERTERHLADVRARIADLRRIESVLATTASRCSGAEVPDCPVLDAISNSADP